MKWFKTVFSIAVTLVFSVLVQAQNNQELVGKWESKNEKEHTKYFIFEAEGKLHAILYYYADDKEKESYEKQVNEILSKADREVTEEDLKKLEELVVLYDFVKKGEKWEGKLIYDEEGSETEAYFKRLNSKTLEVGVESMFYSDKSIWKRIE